MSLLTAGGGLSAQGETAAQRFHWLEGCWAGERGDTRFREIWTVASPELMIGMGTTSEPSKPAEFDYFRIETRDGQLVYVAQPHGVAPTAFTLLASSPRTRRCLPTPHMTSPSASATAA